MSKLVLIDGNAIIHRAYHALPKTLTDANGNLTNAVYGFGNILVKIISDLKPTHVVVCFDRKEPTFRKKINKDYQAHRPEMDESLVSQVDVIKQLVDAFKIPRYEKVGFEADDLIGTLAKQVTKNTKFPISNNKHVDEVVIVTGDKDIMQLIDDKIKVYMPVQGLSQAKLYDKAETQKKLGVLPSQIVDYKALVGDPSDNYKGVPGIGPKTAQDLLTEYGDLDHIYKNLDKIGGSVSEKLKENKDSAYESQKLAQILTDVKIDFDLDAARQWQIDGPQALEFCEKYRLRSLKNRIKSLGKEIASKKQMQLM